jgi:hypothetical protein
MGRVFSGLRAATTLGTHLRGYRFGHVRQLDAVASRLLVNLAGLSPILAGAGQVCFVDVDDTIRETHGYHKQGAAYGYSKVKGLNAILATISTPTAAPVIAAITAGRARFSITARMNTAVTKTIATISDQAWTAIRYPQAIFDEAQQAWISDAEVAEVAFTAFTSRRNADHVTARLIVRPRVVGLMSKPSLVAMTTLSRIGSSASPTRSSLANAPYRRVKAPPVPGWRCSPFTTSRPSRLREARRCSTAARDPPWFTE